MLKNKFITAGLTAALCAVMLASCGGNTTDHTASETETKPKLPSGKIVERSRNFPDNENSGIGGMVRDFERGVERSMDNAEDATHGTARQDGHDNDTEAETDAPMREHRPAAPKGK